MSTTFNATAAYYHQSPLQGSASTPWISGGPRKGISNGQREIGLVLFSRMEIAAALEDGHLPSASLILNRNTAYGTGAVDICIAPVMIDAAPGKMTYDQCLDMAQRGWHYWTSVSGETSRIQLPGAWLHKLLTDPFGGLMIYQEAGEGTSASAKFTETAQLELKTSASYEAPVWRRNIGAGDEVSNAAQSHQADLWELLHYVNVREAADNLTLTDFTGLEIGLYKDWPGAINRLRVGIAAIYSAESKDPITWIVMTSDDLPNAAIINQLRTSMEIPATPDTEILTITKYARTEFVKNNSDFVVNLDSTTEWRAQKVPSSGVVTGTTTINGAKVKQYHHRFGFWLINDITEGKSVASAKILLTRRGGYGGDMSILLYPVLVDELPDERMSVNDVMDVTTLVGSEPAVVGQTTEIELSAAFLAELNDTYFGVGVDDQQQWSEFEASATLIINYQEE